MNAADILNALDLPAAARVERRIPKTLLHKHGAPTRADKRRISDGIEKLSWVATLKPSTIGVPAYRDESREYLEMVNAMRQSGQRYQGTGGRFVNLTTELVEARKRYTALLMLSVS